jgi:hypothetical protein
MKFETFCPNHCLGCGPCLPTEIEQAQTVGEPQRHQVMELPAMKAHVTGVGFMAFAPDDCGAITHTALPPELSFGRQLSARLWLI